MKTLKRYSWFVGLLICLSCSQEKEARRIPVEDFFRNPQKTAFMVSPDGKYISYLQPYKNRLNIFVQTLDGKKVTRLTSGQERNIAYYFWANNNELLYLKDDASEKPTLYAVKRDGTNARDLIPFRNVKIKIITKGRVSGDEVLVALNKRDSTVFDAYRLNIETGKLSLLIKNPGNITQWYADPNGKLRMALASDGVSETLLYRDTEKELFKPIVTNNFKTSITPLGFSDDKTCIYALSNQNRDKKALVEFNWQTGKEHKQIYSNPDVDVSSGIYSTSKKKLVYAGYETWKRQRHYLDDGVKRLYEKLEKLLPNTEIEIIDRDSAESKFIIKTYTDRNPESFYLYTQAANELVKLSDINPPFIEAEMCEMKPVTYKTRDGILINGYLTLPKGGSSKMLPVIVMPRGKPSARNSWGYNAEVQFLANRGYAVFQMNFRGSTGYGKSFWIAGFKQWGGKIQNDITDGVNWLINEGVADPKRIAIFGSSFGGYSALHGLCFQPDLYSCGASFSGFTNLFTFLKSTPPYFKPYQRMIYEMVGNPEADIDYFKAVSPVFHTNRIKKPLLMALGAKDPRVCINETNQFVKELKKRNVPVIYIVKENEGHYFTDQENKLELYRQLEKFLESNLK